MGWLRGTHFDKSGYVNGAERIDRMDGVERKWGDKFTSVRV
jgi:hypothetical protein